MTEHPTSTVQAAEGLRRVLYPPRSLDPGQCAAQVAGFILAAARERPDDPAVARAAAEMAVHLACIAQRAKSPADVKTALHGLIASGRHGRRLAVRFVRDKGMALRELAPLVTSLSLRERIELLHELTRDPDGEDKDVLAWARDLLPGLRAGDPREVLDVLAGLAAQGDVLAFPVRETLLDGPFGAWLRDLLATAADPGLLATAARAVAALEHRELSRALAAAVAERPPRSGSPALPELVRALMAVRPVERGATAKALQAMLAQAGPADAGRCALALARLGWSKAGPAMALLTAKGPETLRAMALYAALLPEAQYRLFLKALPAAQRPEAVRLAFAALGHAAPDQILPCLGDLPAGALPAEGREALAAWLGARRAEHPAGAPRTPPAPPAAPAATGKPKGLLARLLGTGKTPSLTEALEQGMAPKGLNLPGAVMQGADLSSRTVQHCEFPGSTVHGARLRRMTFLGVNFSSLTAADTAFEDCTFKHCTLAGAQLFRCRLAGCAFTACDLSDAVLAGCDLTRCQFDDCAAGGLLLHQGGMERCDLRHTALASAAFQDGALRACRVVSCDLSDAALLGAKLHGAEFHDCHLPRLRLADAELRGCELRACTGAATTERFAGGVRMVQTDGTGPFLAALGLEAVDDVVGRLAAQAARTGRKAKAEGPAPLPAPLRAPEAARVLDALVRAQQRRRAMAAAEAGMLAHNQRRLAWSRRRMTGWECFKLLPLLLDTDIFDQAKGLDDAPPCRLWGYHPDPTALELAEKYFPGVTAGPRPTGPGAGDDAPAGPAGQGGRAGADAARKPAPDGPLRIESLFTMGSVGTIAQTRKSDVDYWVCYDPATADEGRIQGLKRKLEALTVWAAETAGLEAYFFAMSLDAVRANDFGFSDKESSGSAQALLLKEEFYRTAVLVAGKAPVWWVTPPGADAEAYAAALPEALRHPRGGAPRLTDLGHPAQIPAKEFFGACLWQIVKALHSPYKSALKLGLLEHYARAATARDAMLLCERIKENVLAGRLEMQQIDPYALLFKTLRDHYAALGDKDAGQLLLEALLLKAGVETYDFFFGCPSSRPEQSFLTYLLGPGKATEAGVRALARDTSFARSMALGATVTRFMTGSYKRIQAQLKNRGDTAAAITPQDLTRLGRQVAVNFARKEGKVRRVPFLGVGDGGFPELFFTARKAPGKRPEWLALGQTAGEGKVSARDMQLLAKDHDPVDLLAWLTANRIFTPTALVHGDRSVAPLSVVDLKNILSALWDFFPFEATFEIPPAKYLRAERVTKAYFVLNLTAPQDLKKVGQASVVYATNWGELFCRTFADPDPSLTKDATGFLRKNLPHAVPAAPEMRAYFPKRSQCQRFNPA
ncbi:MAG: class I adenylate cyclase [Desulfovibrionaceae bacterium]